MNSLFFFPQSRMLSSGIEFLTGFCLPKSICLCLNLIIQSCASSRRKFLDVTKSLGQLLQCRRRSVQRSSWCCLHFIPGSSQPPRFPQDCHRDISSLLWEELKHLEARKHPVVQTLELPDNHISDTKGPAATALFDISPRGFA